MAVSVPPLASAIAPNRPLDDSNQEARGMLLGLVGAALLLDETLALDNCLFALAVIGVVFAGRRMGVQR